MKLGINDKRVIEAFCNQKSADSRKLNTDGKSLDGAWLGGNGIARWVQGKIVYPETGGRIGDQIQRAVERCSKNGDCGRPKRRR